MIRRRWKVLLATMTLLVLGRSSEAQFNAAYFARSVAVVDITARSVNEKEFVKQVYLKDFTTNIELPEAIGFEGYGYKDDGQNNDAVAGDGIYTTLNTFQHTDENPYNEGVLERSVAPSAFVNSKFAYRSELEDFLSEYQPPSRTEGLEIGVTCDTQWCSCDSECGGCYVSWGAVRGCISCVKFSNCKFTVKWVW